VETILQPTDRADSSPHSAMVRDISRSGIHLVVERPFQTGEFLSIELPGCDDHPATTVLSYVVRAAKRPEGDWALGCTFASELTDEDLEPFGAKRVRSAPPDNRRWVRSPCNVQATFQTVRDPAAKPEPARVLDISASGCGLALARATEVGTLLSLQLTSAQGLAAMTILASVVRASEADGEQVLGCTFLRDLKERELQGLLNQQTVPAART
jgi:c-di-GMP-binding flagellar brake protein YcgR